MLRRLRGRRLTVACLISITVILGTSACSDAANPATEILSNNQGPLEEYMFRITGVMPGDPPETNLARLVADRQRREEFVASCMHSQGFAYYPNVIVPTLIIVEDETGLGWETREFAEQFGFGIAADLTRPGHSFESSGATDPNEQLLSAMSPAERTLWQRALWGELQDGAWSADSAGCSGAAAREFEQLVPAQSPMIVWEVDAFWNLLDAETAPDFISLNNEWATCMFSHGFPDLESPRQLEPALEREFAILQGREILPGGAISGIARPVEPEQLRSFQTREINAAIANFDCKAQIHFDERHQQISWEMQQEFIDRFRTDLELWAEYVEARNP